MLVTLLTGISMLSAMVIETASFQKFIYGQEPACQYDNWISHLAEKVVTPGYNVYSPWDRQTAGFGDFNIPTTVEINNWTTLIDMFLAEQWTDVDSLLVLYGFPYQLVRFEDTDTGRTYYMLREVPDANMDDNGTPDNYDDEQGAFAWGWGLYVYNPNGDNRTIITIPHPCDDFMTPVLGTIAFQTWNTEFLMIAGAGREVQWTGVPLYTNSKSLSDPTRVTNHPFYPAYTKFCTKIRNETGKREFSAQLHAYDTNLHQGFSSVQISAGYNKMCPNLPIRDLSRFRQDLINQSDYLMIPQNTIGTHNDVYINDYYTVQYSVHPFTYDNDGELVTVNDVLDLPAYSQNVQMNYTLQGWSDYDVFEPFFHAEMDELPNCYAQTDNNYKWFYNWNTQTQRWEMDHLFDHTIDYYSYWINTMAGVLTQTLQMNDNLDPLPPSNLTVFNQSYDYITLQWQKADDFDFDTYEILYSTQPIANGTYSIYYRNQNSYLASPYCEQVDITGLANSAQYYFQIRAKDKNGNYSTLSNEVTGYTSPVKIVNYRAIGLDNQAVVKWTVVSQLNNQGFRIYRSANNGAFDLMDSYANNPALAGGNPSYQWNDTTVRNGIAYTYKISCVNTSDVEFFHNVTFTCHPRDYYTLYVGREDETIIDSLTFSANPNASAGNDSEYDIVKAAAPSSSYVYGAFWEQYWGNNGTYLQQEIMADFIPSQSIRTWAIRVKSDQLNTPLVIRVDDTFLRYSEKLYLRDNSTGAMTNLETGLYSFQVSDTNYKNFTLYWGNLQPALSISAIPNRVYQGNTVQTFYWNSTYSFLVDHYDVFIMNDTDSILVASNLPNTVTNYAYTFPGNITMHNCRFYVDAISTDGQRIRQVSGYQFGIVPVLVTYNPEPGLSMPANVFPGSALTGSQVFGTEARVWTMDSNSAWWEISPFSYGLGYWVDKVNPFEFTSSAVIQRDSTSFVLRAGWNIVPNPHLCSYQIKDLRFRINNIYYSFAEFLDQRLVSPAIYVYRNGSYELTDVIYPQESFLIKYYGATTLVSSVVFIPYNNGVSIARVNPEWMLKLTATQDNSDRYELSIGSNFRTTDDYEFRYDLPEPPAKPVESLTRLYLTRTHADSLFLDLNLNSEFRSPFGTVEEEEKVWSFRLEIGNTNPVNFTVDSSLFPDNYGASINIGTLMYDIQHGDSFVLTPTQSGILNGQIVVHNYFTGNADETAATLISGVNVYPNPFRGQSNLAFKLAKNASAQVDIYNIKGQQIRTLYNGSLKSGINRIAWNGTDDNGKATGTGIYFARIQSQGMVKTVKMMLIK